MTLRIVLLTIGLAARLWAAPEPRTLVCNFDGENSSKVYRVFTSVGVGSTFRLPDGWKITDDPLQFAWEDRNYFADLGIERIFGVERDGQKMAIEIKSFIGQNFSFDFYEALGQFDNYFIALSEIEPARKVALAPKTSVICAK